ncbi:Thioesterase/thiol ester dehydrase-isomerase [Xylariaceae sp. FL0016]|nr:Thioesterase/thiol ester dehydrase-isomerase [Xylariaceae sp. FL0016]
MSNISKPLPFLAKACKAQTATKLPASRFVKSVLKSFMAESGLEPRLLGPHLRVTQADHGKVNFELSITKDHTNRLNILHGGTIASMVDLGGSLAVASKGLYATGVSTDLNVTYLSSGGKIGDKLFATATCDKIGKTLAYTSIVFQNSKGELAARGSHTKYVAQAMSAQKGEPYVVPEGAEIDMEEGQKD